MRLTFEVKAVIHRQHPYSNNWNGTAESINFQLRVIGIAFTLMRHPFTDYYHREVHGIFVICKQILCAALTYKKNPFKAHTHIHKGTHRSMVSRCYGEIFKIAYNFLIFKRVTAGRYTIVFVLRTLNLSETMQCAAVQCACMVTFTYHTFTKFG